MDSFIRELGGKNTDLCNAKKSVTYKLWHLYPFLFSHLDYHTYFVCLADTQIVRVKLSTNH